MSRFALIRFLPVLVLVGCNAPQPDFEVLAPDQVLKQAAQASINLQSVAYVLDGNVQVENAPAGDIDAVLKLDGTMDSAGDQIQMNADIDASVADGIWGDMVINSNLDLMLFGQDEMYMRINTLQSSSNNPLFRQDLVDLFSRQWWYFPSTTEQEGVAPAAVTPDPRLLNAQAQVIKVERELPLSQIGGRYMYHYDVSIDREKLLTYLTEVARESGEDFDVEETAENLEELDATGQIWIDAQTYYIHKLQWEIKPFTPESGQRLSANFSAAFTRHDMVDPIAPPTDAQEFQPLTFFDAPLPAGSVGTPGLQIDQENAIIEKILDQENPSPYISE